MTDVTPFDYAGMAQDCLDLLTEFGQQVSIRRVANTGTPYAPTQTTTDYPALGIVVNFPRWYSAFATPNNDILRTDRMGIIAAKDVTISPTVNDQFVAANGTVFQIIDFKPMNPAGTPLAYTFQLRS